MKKYEMKFLSRTKPARGFRKLLLVADAHLNGGEKQEAFADFLRRTAGLPETCAVAFLGDIFDLWFALPGYETEDQKRFLAWCDKEKDRRDIYFVEGNHEFFVTARRKKHFSRAVSRELRFGDLLLVHGDQINSSDWQYKLLRFGLRNPLTKVLTQCGALGGVGPALSWKIRHGLAKVNVEQKKRFPEQEILHYLEKTARRGIRSVIAGHFHHERKLERSGCRFSVIESFATEGKISLYDADTQTLETGFYGKLLDKLEKREKVTK